MNQGRVEAKTTKGDHGGIRLGGAWYNCTDLTSPFVKALNYGDEVEWQAEGKSLTYIKRLKTSEYARPRAPHGGLASLNSPEILACMKIGARLCDHSEADFKAKTALAVEVFRVLRGG